MTTHSRISSRNGDFFLRERKVLGIWFFTVSTVQKWTPLMSEVERERGVRFGSFRFSMTQSRVVWYDGKEPRVEKRSHTFG